MSSLGVVEYIAPCFAAALVDSALDLLALEHLEKALGDCVGMMFAG
jgi:hypothetical protein